MKRFFKLGLLALIVVVIAVFALTACNYETEVGEELISNGGFELTDENSDGDVVISSWSRGSKDSTFESSDILISPTDSSVSSDYGKNTLKIENTKATATYVYQSVKVDSGKAYKISYSIKITQEITAGSEYPAGAFITFLENTDYVLTEQTAATGGWKNVTLYVSPKNTDYLTICLKLGDETNTSIGSVYYDNVSMMRVDNVPSNATVYEISREKVVRYNETDSGIAFIVLLTLLSVALIVAAYILVRRIYGSKNGLVSVGENVVATADDKKAKIRKVATHPVAIASYLAIGTLLVRFILLFTLFGFGQDMTNQIALAKAMSSVAPANIFAHLAKNGYASFAPGQLYLLYVFGGIGQNLDAAGMSIWLRIPSIIADIAVVLTIYFYGKKYVGNKISTVYAALYSLLPIVFVMSGARGSFESVLVALILIAFVLLIEKKYILAYILFTLSVLFDVNALAVVPLAVCYLVFAYYRADVTLKSFNAQRAQIIFGFIGSWILFYVLSIPFVTNYISEQPFYIFTYYKDIIANNNIFASNAFNLYAMVSMNGKAVNDTAAIFNLIFLLVLQIYVISLYIKNKNRLELLMLASFELAIVAVFTIKVNYAFLFMSLALLVVYTMISGEKRAYIALGGLSVLTFLNVGQLMNQSNFVSYNTTGALVTFESLDAFLIFFSVITVLFVLFYGYLSYSICNNSKKYDIPAMNDNFFVTTKNFFQRLKKKMK